MHPAEVLRLRRATDDLTEHTTGHLGGFHQWVSERDSEGTVRAQWSPTGEEFEIIVDAEGNELAAHPGDGRISLTGMHNETGRKPSLNGFLKASGSRISYAIAYRLDKYRNEDLMHLITNSVKEQLPAVERSIEELDSSLDKSGIVEVYGGFACSKDGAAA